MKYLNKFVACSLAVAMSGMFASCVNDLDQGPKDPSVVTSGEFSKNPQQYLAGLLANCYAGMTVSGQGGAGSSDITSPDAGMSCYSRAIYMLNEFPTDEVAWIYFSDAGVEELVKATWGSDNPVLNLAYSRLYTHIAVCNDFLRNVKFNLDAWGIDPSQLESPDGRPMTEVLEQFCREARALRAYSYYNVIDFFGRAAVAWDVDDEGNMIPYGAVPPQAESRAALYRKVVADLEEVLNEWPDSEPVVYGRIGKDAVRALLTRFYQNEEVFTNGESSGWQKCWDMCQEIIQKHNVGANHGLAQDYLALFGASNDRFMPGGTDTNEILWGLPYDNMNTQSYGGSDFLIFSVIIDSADKALTDGFCNKTWYGVQSAWGCMHARTQFSNKFDRHNDYRTYLWLTENAGYSINNTTISKFTDGYLPIKFTNIPAGADGTYYKTTDANGLNRILAGPGVPVNANYSFVDTDLPLIRLAEVYLTAAECTLHGAGNSALAMQYVRWVRERAGLQTNIAALDADFILDERARELYWENVRRTDLVRFGKFTGSSYTWNWKNGVSNGASIPDHMNVYPIPSAIVSSYGAGQYVQNPNY